jgi:predicted nucleic acid-binding protein
VRVSSNGRAIPDARSPSQAIALLSRMRAQPGHVFWSDDVSPVDADAGAFTRVVGYRQVTDAHLLTMALRRGGVLATFDRGVLELTSNDAQGVELIP